MGSRRTSLSAGNRDEDGWNDGRRLLPWREGEREGREEEEKGWMAVWRRKEGRRGEEGAGSLRLMDMTGVFFSCRCFHYYSEQDEYRSSSELELYYRLLMIHESLKPFAFPSPPSS